MNSSEDQSVCRKAGVRKHSSPQYRKLLVSSCALSHLSCCLCAQHHAAPPLEKSSASLFNSFLTLCIQPHH